MTAKTGLCWSANVALLGLIKAFFSFKRVMRDDFFRHNLKIASFGEVREIFVIEKNQSF